MVDEKDGTASVGSHVIFTRAHHTVIKIIPIKVPSISIVTINRVTPTGPSGAV